MDGMEATTPTTDQGEYLAPFRADVARLDANIAVSESIIRKAYATIERNRELIAEWAAARAIQQEHIDAVIEAES